MSRIFRHAGGVWPNLLVMTYMLCGWPFGIWLLTLPHRVLNAAGVLLTAHALVISGYLIHECVHQTLFATPEANDRFGKLCAWVNGACVAHYAGLKKKHLRHHADRLDAVTFDYRAALNSRPPWVRSVVLGLEWAYVPVIELMMRGMVIAAPFYFGTVRDRARVVMLVLLRVALFAGLAWISLRAVLLYAVAYLLFLHVLRFMDAYQHTYEVFPTRSLEPAPFDPRRNRRYEYENTYSNLVAVRWPWLNLLTLNFAYHNAHHARSGEPWYRLPALHYVLYGAKDPQVLPCRDLIAGYHRNRVARVLSEDYGSVSTGEARASQFIGAVGVSFLTAI